MSVRVCHFERSLHQFTLCDVTKYSFQLQTQHIEVTLAVVEAVQCTLMHFGHDHYSLLFEVKFLHF